MFTIPLVDEAKFAYGYVVHVGDFILSNIYDFAGDEIEPPEHIQNYSLVIRDLLHDRSPFLPRMRKLGRLCFWPLARQRVTCPLPPGSRYVIHGSHTGAPKFYDFIDQVYVDQSSIDGSVTVQHQTLHAITYYPNFVHARMLRKSVRFDTATSRYVIE